MINVDRKLICLVIILSSALLVTNASAITMESLNMQISENGDTTVSFGYSLSPLEYLAVFMKIADPSEELRKAIDERTDRDVEILEVSSDSSSFFIPGFITPVTGSEGKTYTTPAIDFTKGEEILRSYWFAPLITIDLSPSTTKIVFPDGYTESFENTIAIPSITHTV